MNKEEKESRLFEHPKPRKNYLLKAKSLNIYVHI